MSDYICPYLCSYRTNSGFCGYTGGHDACQYRNMRIYSTNCTNFTIGGEKRTNADRIRSMTDEEIADFLCDIGECDRRCPAKIGDCIFSDSTCRIAWLAWLKQEVA